LINRFSSFPHVAVAEAGISRWALVDEEVMDMLALPADDAVALAESFVSSRDVCMRIEAE
jgi:hypothetical protein